MLCFLIRDLLLVPCDLVHFEFIDQYYAPKGAQVVFLCMSQKCLNFVKLALSHVVLSLSFQYTYVSTQRRLHKYLTYHLYILNR